MKRIITAAITMHVGLASVALGQSEGTIYLPPVEDAQEELDQLTDDLTPAERLRQVLADGNKKLAEAIAEHQRVRSFETKDKVYALLVQLARATIAEIGRLESNEGRMRDSLRTMVRKVDAVRQNVATRIQELSENSELTEQRVRDLDDELRDLAREISRKPGNEKELRQQFRRKLVMAKRLSRQHGAYGNHKKLHTSFGEQLERVQSFLTQLDGNLDMLLEGLSEQRSLLVLRIELLRDSAEVEQWLRDVGGSGESVMAVATRLIGLQNSLEQFDAASDLIVKLDDVGDLIDLIPDLNVLEGEAGNTGNLSAAQIEDRYIEHYLSN
ncbi:MAG: hypothetical protein ACYTHJ_06655 [Planctomycetota bacterium]|jgi:chromosome segregation ATPase